MRATLKTLVFGLGLSAALAGAASGPAMAEALVMPFSCHIAGGRVVLAPAAPQSYRIYGHAEHQQLNTCSPYNPRKCHNWSVHRFDLDCGGVRTSWPSVVAALTPILAESVGTAAGGDQGYDAYGPPPGRAGPYAGRGGGISFPRGFAPNPMNVARFTGTSPTVAEIPLPPKKPEATAADTQVAAVDANPEAVAHEPDVADLNVPDLTIPEPGAMPSMPAIPSVESNTEAASTNASDKTVPAATPAATKAAPEASDVAGYRSLKVELDTEVTGALPKSGASATAWQSASTIFMWTLAVLFALTATLLLGRQRIMERLPSPARLLLLRGPAKLPAVQTSAPGPETERYTEAVRKKEATASRLRLWDEDWLPRTMLEALDVLGVDPDASRDTMKTTVKRLRRALHPDHAIDDEDRTLRERRLKQINVAWDIIAGKRRVPWLKQSG